MALASSKDFIGIQVNYRVQIHSETRTWHDNNIQLKYKWFKISYLEFGFCKYYFEHTTFLYLSRRSSGHHKSFFNFKFSSRKSQSQQKTSKKDHTFYNTVSLKKPHLFHLALKTICTHNAAKKTFWLYKFSSKHVSVCFQKKMFALHHFLMPKNCILEALSKKMSVYFYISVCLLKKTFVLNNLHNLKSE